INFLDDDLVSMAANTHFAIDQFEDKREKQKKTSFFSMLKGKTMFFALRLFRYKQMAFRVKTPTAVVGVRGTKFGVHVRWTEKGRASKDLPLVASRSAAEAFMVASAGGQGKSCTDAFCMDGLIEVDGKVVPAGYTYHCETGEVSPSDPDYLRQFEEDTGLRERKEKGEKKGERELSIPRTPYQGFLAGSIDQQADITNDQKLEQGEENLTTGKHMGYFSALLSSVWGLGYPANFDNVYVTSSAQDFDSGNARANSLNGTDYITINPGFVTGSTSYVTRIVTSYGDTDSGELGTGYPLNVTRVGSNEYMEWGYWTMQSSYPDPDTYPNYIVNNPAWYVFGLTTREEVISNLTGMVGYSGNAYGTFWSSSGGVSMNGLFNCQVDFTSGSESGFNLSVSGGGYGASISGAGGSLNGGEFSLSGGSWQLSTPTGIDVPDETIGAGTFYGPNAEYIGGSWGMRNGESGNTATGIFHGGR
ncbi:MAG: hypothetical protein DRH12_18690, partial [Deltaproteobacteria bacterium]